MKRYPQAVPKKAPKTSRGDTSGAYKCTISVLYTSRRKAMFDLPKATVNSLAMLTSSQQRSRYGVVRNYE